MFHDFVDLQRITHIVKSRSRRGTEVTSLRDLRFVQGGTNWTLTGRNQNNTSPSRSYSDDSFESFSLVSHRIFSKREFDFQSNVVFPRT